MKSEMSEKTKMECYRTLMEIAVSMGLDPDEPSLDYDIRYCDEPAITWTLANVQFRLRPLCDGDDRLTMWPSWSRRGGQPANMMLDTIRVAQSMVAIADGKPERLAKLRAAWGKAEAEANAVDEEQLKRIEAFRAIENKKGLFLRRTDDKSYMEGIEIVSYCKVWSSVIRKPRERYAGHNFTWANRVSRLKTADIEELIGNGTYEIVRP